MTYTVEEGCEQKYINEEIHFQDALIVEGKAIFENCRIFCNEAENSKNIMINSSGKLIFNNCQIICCGINESFFVESNIGSLEIYECHILNFYNFVGGTFHKLEVNNCEFNDCVGNIIDATFGRGILFAVAFMASLSKFKIYNCRFICKNVPQYLKNQEISIEKPLLKGSFEITRSSFEVGYFPLKLFKLRENSELKKCKFVNVNDVPADLCYGMTTCIDCQFEIKPKGETK